MTNRLVAQTLLLVSIVLGSPRAFGADGLPTVAVLDLGFTPAEEEMAADAADLLTQEMINSGKYTVVERRKISHVIKEQALGQTGLISDETAVKVGQVLGARFLILGRLSRLGDIHRLDVRMVDAQTAKIVTSAHSDFKDRSNLDLAAREAVRGLVSPGSTPGAAAASPSAATPDASAGKGAAKAGTPDVVVDAGKARDAAADIAKQISAKFVTLRTKLDSVDDGGRATFPNGGQFTFPGMGLAIYGTDSMTGERGLKGYMLVQNIDPSMISGRTKPITDPCAPGDDAVSLPFRATIHGPSADATKALSAAINGLQTFNANAKEATPVDVQFDLKGSAVGDRHLSVRVLDNNANILATYDSAVSL